MSPLQGRVEKASALAAGFRHMAFCVNAFITPLQGRVEQGLPGRNNSTWLRCGADALAGWGFD